MSVHESLEQPFRPSFSRSFRLPWLSLAWLKRYRALILPGLILGLIVLSGLFAPIVAPYDPNAIDIGNALSAPSWEHWLGTDQLGRDYFTRVLYGGQTTLFLAGFSTIVVIAIGLAIGLISGYVGGADTVISTFLTVLLALPNLLLTLAILGILGPSNETLLIALIGAGWVGHARVFRASVLSLREQVYVESAKALGFSPWRIMFRHILPNLLPTVVVLATLDIGAFLLLISSLSFLGLGSQPPAADWGVMLSDARPYFTQVPMLVFAPGVLITLVVLTCNLLGDAIRDLVDFKR
jgi:peptide/nickel transport system permease protein